MMAEPLPQTSRNGLRYLPLLAIAAVAIIGAFTLRDYLTFETLRANREALIAFRDQHYLWSALGFIGIYIVLVAFSLPGATIATLTGGFLFGVFPGALFNVGAATIGACATQGTACDGDVQVTCLPPVESRVDCAAVGKVCVNTSCQNPVGACNEFHADTCSGDVLTVCVSGAERTFDCASVGASCGALSNALSGCLVP